MCPLYKSQELIILTGKQERIFATVYGNNFLKSIPEIRAHVIVGFAYHVTLMPESGQKVKRVLVMKRLQDLVALDLAPGRNSSIFVQSSHIIYGI